MSLDFYRSILRHKAGPFIRGEIRGMGHLGGMIRARFGNAKKDTIRKLYEDARKEAGSADLFVIEMAKCFPSVVVNVDGAPVRASVVDLQVIAYLKVQKHTDQTKSDVAQRINRGKADRPGFSPRFYYRPCSSGEAQALYDAAAEGAGAARPAGLRLYSEKPIGPLVNACSYHLSATGAGVEETRVGITKAVKNYADGEHVAIATGVLPDYRNWLALSKARHSRKAVSMFCTLRSLPAPVADHLYRIAA